MTDFSLFGMLILEREPFRYADFLGLFQAWLQDAGGFAALGLIFYLLYALRIPSEQSESAKYRAGVSGWMLLMAVLSLAAYVGFLVLWLGLGRGYDTTQPPPPPPGYFQKYTAPKFSTDLQPLTIMFGGLFAILGIGQPFVASLARLKFRRLFSLAKLGFKEAVRNRVVWVFLVALLPVLFPITWFVPTKPEDELRINIAVTSGTTQLLVLIIAALLASFGIPNDIKNQNIYTIVSKPVERFEVVFGRFLGYVALMSLALLGMTLVGYVFIVTKTIDAKAQLETQRARVPLRGEMRFQSRKVDFDGTNVGREFEYRRYIGGDPNSPQRAIWSYQTLPSGLANHRLDYVPCEFTFDIFRMTKGEENRGVDVNIRVVTWQSEQRPPSEQNDGEWKWVNDEKRQAYLKDAQELVGQLPGVSPQQAQNPDSFLALARPGTPAWDVVNKLAEKHGFYEVRGKEVYDYHPETIAIPAGVFKNALNGDPKPQKVEGFLPDGKKETREITPPRVQIIVQCTTRSQMLGMAEADLYLLAGERTFTENYFKSVFGLWCRVCIVIGLAITCSTYLAGVINFLLTLGLFLGGYASEHLVDIASGHSSVGGPFRAVSQIFKAEQPTAIRDETNPFTRAAEGGDVIFAWIMRRFINVVPDVYAFSWTDFIKEGFNIPFECMVMNFVVTVGYLLPWFILAYFLFRSREVAA